MSLIKRKTYKFHDYSINRYSALFDAGNDDLHVDERRYADRLKVTANGIMYMGIWTFIKIFLNMLDETKEEMVDTIGEGTVALIAGIIVMVLLFLILLVLDLALRYIVWRCAGKEATTGKKSFALIPGTIILMIYGAYAIGAFFHILITEKRVEGDDVVKLVFDVTSFILLWWILAATFKLRKTREELQTIDRTENNREEILQ